MFFDVLSVLLGALTGTLIAFLPDPRADERPIGTVLLFSVSLGLLVTVLPVCATQASFGAVVVLTLTMAATAYLVTRLIRTTWRIVHGPFTGSSMTHSSR